jgi:hypothetical protein
VKYSATTLARAKQARSNFASLRRSHCRAMLTGPTVKIASRSGQISGANFNSLSPAASRTIQSRFSQRLAVAGTSLA